MKTKMKHVLNADKSWNFDESNAENYVGIQKYFGTKFIEHVFYVQSRNFFRS